jgi:hypothetical protein
LAPHLRFIEGASRKLARSIFYGMLVHRAGLERRQAFLFRLVDIAMELFAMTAVVTRTRRMRAQGDATAAEAEKLADLFCRTSRRVVASRFRALWRNDDARRYEVGRDVLGAKAEWLETGIVSLHHSAEDLRPQEVEQDGVAAPTNVLTARSAVTSR